LTELQNAVRERLSRVRALIFDMDGTLVLGNAASGAHEALPGAVELLALLKARGIPFRVFTNGTAKAPRVYAASLRAAGLDVDDSEMMTPSTAAADWFVRRGIRRVRVLGLEGVQAPLREAGLDVVGPSEKADGVEAVFTGWFREFTFPDLEAACRDVWAGALLTTASNVPFFAARGGRAIGASFAINAMIRSLTGKKAKVLGKPSRCGAWALPPRTRC
jgi:ribonucleotide monophosphatase NagD (HAD superfamily)